MTPPRCDRTAAWAALGAHYAQAGHAFDLRRAFAQDGERFARFSQAAPHVFADLSKNYLDATTEALLLDLARECGVEAQREAMFEGQPINRSEQRAAMHFLLRNPALRYVSKPFVATEFVANAAQEVAAVQQAMLAFAERVRADAAITDIVHIGIGGSDLGPAMATLALQAHSLAGKRLHFVSNVDGDDLAGALRGLQPRHTLFLIASKTFTTAETMLNAHSARQWFLAQGGSTEQLPQHFVGLTTNLAAARAFGISTTFGFWDWVGGRYSLWSAIGLPLAIAIGAAGFRALLDGAHAMDEHFRSAPLAHNLPVRLALLDLWYRNFHRTSSRCVAPYSHALRRLPAYLQQLEMESNGKGVDQAGQPLACASAPVVWGEPGTNGQHAFFQMLHQGTDLIPVEFILVRHPAHDRPQHHQALLANALAQSQALMQGRSSDDGQRHFSGNRPSTTLLLERLDPASLGALLALYEHRTFVQGALWGINSFDQWGVELGKALAQDLAARLQSGDGAGVDGSTAGLLGRLRAGGGS